jgi:hypothetical protein
MQTATYASETYHILNSQAGKDIVKINKKGKAKKEARGVAPGVLLEAGAGDELGQKGGKRSKERRHCWPADEQQQWPWLVFILWTIATLYLDEGFPKGECVVLLIV